MEGAGKAREQKCTERCNILGLQALLSALFFNLRQVEVIAHLLRAFVHLFSVFLTQSQPMQPPVFIHDFVEHTLLAPKLRALGPS